MLRLQRDGFGAPELRVVEFAPERLAAGACGSVQLQEPQVEAQLPAVRVLRGAGEFGFVEDAAFEVGYAEVNGFELEIIEPFEGESVHRDVLEEHGEGIYHVACFAFDDPYEITDAFEDAGISIVQSGQWHDTHYMYFDTRDIMNGVYLETLAGGEYDPGSDYRCPQETDGDSAE